MDDLAEGQRQNAGFTDGLEGGRRVQVGPAGEGFAKQLARPHGRQDGRIAPGVFVDHMDPPFKDDADIGDFIPGQNGEFSLMQCLEAAADALQHGLQVVCVDSGKQRQVGQHFIIGTHGDHLL